MNTLKKTSFAGAGVAALAWLLTIPLTELPAAADPPREQPRASAPRASSSGGSAARSRSSGTASRGSSGTASRGSSGSSPSGGTAARTRSQSDSGDRGPSRVRGSSTYRGERYHTHHRRHHYGGVGFGLYWPWYWGSYGHYGYGGDYGYYGHHGYPGYRSAYPYYYGPWRPWWGGGYPRYESEPLGALDLDIRPEKAEVWIDGEYVGVCDQFDGFPSYLWLPEGVYDITLYRDGYRNLSRQYTVRPGAVIDVEDRLEPGEGERPVPREQRAERQPERRAERQPERRPYASPSRGGNADGGAIDARGEPGMLRVEVSPGDASVYLDGRFLGTGRELSELHAGLMVDPGSHRLEVVRPGYAADEVELEVVAGEELEVRVTLEEGG